MALFYILNHIDQLKVALVTKQKFKLLFRIN